MTGIDVALAGLGVAFLLGLIRTAIGPTVADRAVGADVCLFTLVAVFGLMGVRSGSEMFLDVVLVATLLGFLATVALARLVGKRGDQ
ncbi:pesticidal protein Cry26Aa [Egibacter rhizosphaerae]|uniref:Pesticidal protein Cry26Aa n=1 Tax=Egibacter rhizosphaerae TaxID=1670831 RepID=A0A411YEA0_9ACTN|nr:monovalent cation/H+ antiporter complex subunit F [Egibacter rhizosphaerae]QBI19510.1 pesticidal protein Cry26Aa [Egibacter rhizosphaerae]